jgi:DNA ligase-1
LGIGEGAAIKLVAEVTGRSAAKIKQAMAEVGDLGQIAETSKGSQRLMFQPARLTVRGVYETFLRVAKMKGKEVSSRSSMLFSE